MPDLTHDELRRYARHLAIPEFGIEGQRKLKAARVLCIGAGGLGSPISTGLNLNDTSRILEGAVPAAALALIVQGAFALLERALVPRGLAAEGARGG